MNKELKQKVQDERRKKDLESINQRMMKIRETMKSLITQFEMIQAINNRLIREEYEKNQYDWKKDKSLSVNK